MHKKISVIGAGSWGTALAILFAEKQAEICLWGHNPEVVKELIDHRTNSLYLPGLHLPSNIRATDQLEDSLDAEFIFMATPSKAIRSVIERISQFSIPSDAVFISCTKGIEHETGKLMSEVLADYLPKNPLAVLSGPNHAAEVAKKIPAAAVLGSAHPDLLKRLQKVFFLPSFRLYTSADIKGIQLGGALKNVCALAAGASDGLNMGDNAKAALVTRALAEITRLGVALGGQRETFYGLSGVGDLMVTCFSRHSRNRAFGERLGRGETLTAIEDSMHMVAEGVFTARSAWRLAHELSVEAPIIKAVYQVLYESKPPHDALWELLERQPRAEPESFFPENR
ncbi:MAG: glycerol-3-phosphate dehydrogenase [Verrucomicrobia bacterium]|nr:MAG: glycerol-3-phosphate dehydrogenase [Verrucomicrobiota bacterium]